MTPVISKGIFHHHHFPASLAGWNLWFEKSRILAYLRNYSYVVILIINSALYLNTPSPSQITKDIINGNHLHANPVLAVCNIMEDQAAALDALHRRGRQCDAQIGVSRAAIFFTFHHLSDTIRHTGHHRARCQFSIWFPFQSG